MLETITNVWGQKLETIPVLIISKLFWAKDNGSEIQMGDVQNLAATGFDIAYVENWTRELGLTNLWEQCRP